MSASGFKECALGDLAEFKNGKFIPSSDYSPVGRHPVFGANGPISRTDELLNPKPVVVIGRVGAFCGSVHAVHEPSWVTDNAIVAEPKPGVDYRFLYYRLKSIDLNRTAIGSAQPLITQSGLRIVRTVAPELPAQRAIAHVLGTFDDKIELNRRMNETLEAMAQALFKSWFVDATRNGLPEGWREGTLGEVAENMRRTVEPKQIDSSTPYIGLEHMPRRCIALSEWGQAGELESNKFKFKRGELLFGKLRPYFHKVGVAPVDGVCSTDILVIRPKTSGWFGFVLGHASSVDLVNHTDAASTGTKMPRTSWNDIARYEVAVPPKDIAEAFTVKINPMIEGMISNIHESRTLAALRGTLLPKLISGQVALNSSKELPT
jgi:type I restriction enzyme S subunit